MCFPQEIIHELDAWSPLMPPPVWGAEAGVYHWHPPAMEHARVKTTSNNDTTDDVYDPDLCTSWPGVAHRSSSKDPGGPFRLRNPHIQTAKCLGMSTGRRLSHPRRHRPSLGLSRRIEKPDPMNMFEMIQTLSYAVSSEVPPDEESDTPPSLSPPRPHSLQRDITPNENSPLLPSFVERGSDEEDREEGSRKPFTSPLPLPEDLPYFSSRNDPTAHQKSLHQEEDDDETELPIEREEREMVMRFFHDRAIEIIALVEGQDSTTGGVVQARHSYKVNEILWNTSFLPCVLQDEEDGSAVIDFSLFHHTELTYDHEHSPAAEQHSPPPPPPIDAKVRSKAQSYQSFNSTKGRKL
jgi:hypothetical protein